MNATPSINAAILAVQRDITAIDKDRPSTQGYKFRGIDDVMNEVHPHFTKHGIFITTKVLENTREERASKSGGVLVSSIMKVSFTFHAEDGSSVDCEMIGEGMDSGDKSSPKALSIAFKYAILQMFTIPTLDPKDPENDNPEPLAKNLALPGSKESRSYDDWRKTTWHLAYGGKKAPDGSLAYAYKDHTLAEIELNDPEGLNYWCNAFKVVGKKPEDLNLRLMLDKAKFDSSRSLPEQAPAPNPLNTEQVNAAEDLGEPKRV